MTDKEQEASILEKIRVLNSVVSNSTPCDEQSGYGEYTKYIPVFEAKDRDIIKRKIMELIKSL